MSPRSEEFNAMIKDERREQILHAALMAFATKGFSATKISDIVAGANMSHGLVYHYFKSKEEIFSELLKRAMWGSAHSLEMVETAPISPLEKVRQTAKYILGAISDFEDTAYYFLIVIHASIMAGLEMDREQYARDSTMAMQAMARILKAGQETGEVIDGDPMAMTTAFFATIQGLAMYKLAIGEFKMPDPEILVNMVKKP